MIAGLPPSAK